jgi:hypothetical protein
MCKRSGECIIFFFIVKWLENYGFQFSSFWCQMGQALKGNCVNGKLEKSNGKP